MSFTDDEDYKVFGLQGQNSVFYVNFCNTDRTWRK